MKKWVFFLSVMALLVGAGILLSAYCVSLPADSPAPDFYILNTNTMVFHPPSCPSTEKMKDSGVGVSTLYRRLAALCREGLLTRFRAADGEYVYRSTGRADAECNCLFHLKCTVCGCVSHLDCRHGQELIEHIGAEHGFRIDRCKTVLYGECARCAAKEGQKNK